MKTLQRLIPNLYRDSVSLMQLSEEIQSIEGITQASAIMASENNISLLLESGLLESSIEPHPNDLLIVVSGENSKLVEKAMETAEELLMERKDVVDSEAIQTTPLRSIQMSLEKDWEANLALISSPGTYAAAEALKAMSLGLHVLMFSDNVSYEDEVMLKKYSEKHDLLFMGPDCGTAIINGLPLGFANVVKQGNIGVVAAAGTGLQQVTSLIDRKGGGISQAIGTGGHDLSAKVGGITMRQGIRALAADSKTDVIVLISKPPSPSVMEIVLEEAEKAGKPVVINFIGADPEVISGNNLLGVPTLEAAAAAAVNLALGEKYETPRHDDSSDLKGLAENLVAGFIPGQAFIRGLFSGGTFCFEAMHLLGKNIGPVYSNIPINPDWMLKDVWNSYRHTAIDLGDDLFTQGRPHPMIDFRLRNERILQEAADPEVAVILLDIVLGYGSNMDPASEIIPAINKAHTLAKNSGRHLVFIASVCGTESDPQNLHQQEYSLREAGVTLTESNAQAAFLAADVINNIKG